ncbi:MAG: hypothetical protein F6K44_30030 [Moorea sp. SIO3E2]|nr:hypothetical protein [Moorena sp. SIO3E2]
MRYISSLLPIPYSRFPIHYSLLPKTMNFVPHGIDKCYILRRDKRGKSGKSGKSGMWVS